MTRRETINRLVSDVNRQEVGPSGYTVDPHDHRTQEIFLLIAEALDQIVYELGEIRFTLEGRSI